MLEFLGPGLDFVGNILGNESAKDEARKNRNFQERMSSTSYTRAAADLDNAGLNRVLALGSGASTPSGATAAIENPKIGSTGIMAASAKQHIAQSQAEERLIDQRRDESSANEQLALTNVLTAKTQADLNAATARLTAARAAKEERYVPVHKTVGDAIEDVAEGVPDLKFLPGFLQEKGSNAADFVVDKFRNFQRFLDDKAKGVRRSVTNPKYRD